MLARSVGEVDVNVREVQAQSRDAATGRGHDDTTPLLKEQRRGCDAGTKRGSSYRHTCVLCRGASGAGMCDIAHAHTVDRLVV